MLRFLDKPLQPTGSCGAFGVATDALWNPGGRSIPGCCPPQPSTPSHGLKGFNYLGAGLIAPVVLIVGARLTRRAEERGTTTSLRALLWLLPGSAVLAAVASGGRLAW